MRVAVVSMRTVHRRETGSIRRIQRVAEELDRRGHDVTVFCAQWWDGYARRFEHDGITYRGVTTGIAPGSFAARIPFLLARFAPDAVHARPLPPAVVLGAATGATLARAPLVTDWYGDEDYPDTHRGRAALGVPDLSIAPSELVCSRVRDAGRDGPTAVVPEPVDFDLVRGTEPVGDADVVLGRHLDADANLDAFLLALADLEGDWTATVVGDGPERAAAEERAADLRLSDRVEFVGDVSRAERVALYRGAHAFVHTATRAPFAGELLCGLACGCVGVVEYQTDSAAHELVDGHERAVTATTDEGVTDAIREAREYPNRTIDESMAGYDRDAVLDEYLDCYEAAR